MAQSRQQILGTLPGHQIGKMIERVLIAEPHASTAGANSQAYIA